MARYIKANPKVAQHLHLENDRNTVKDGNYLLWQADMLPFGPLSRLGETLEQIGGISLMPHEAREEQDGTVTRPLPEAKDPRFVIEQPTVEEEAPTEGVEAAGSEEQQPEGEDTVPTEEIPTEEAQNPETGDADATTKQPTEETAAGEEAQSESEQETTINENKEETV